MPLEKRVGARSMSMGGEPGTAWGQGGSKGDQFQLSEQDLADLRKLQQLQLNQEKLLAAGGDGFKTWGSEREAGKLDQQAPGENTYASMPRKKEGLPPRAPTSGHSSGSVLPSMPSMVDRLNDSSKDYVDPKDAQNLLPSSLLDSTSLDLANYMEAFDSQKQQLGGAGVNLQALNLVNPQAATFDLSALQGGIPRRQRAGAGPQRGHAGFQDGPSSGLATSVPPSIPPDTNVLPLRRRAVHHQRSNSEPVLPGFTMPAFPVNQAPVAQVGQGTAPAVAATGVRTVPVLAVLPDFSVLPADLIDGQGLSARGPPIRNVIPVRTKDRTMSFDQSALLQGMGGYQDRQGHNRTASRGDPRTDARGSNSRRRNKAQRSMSVDMGRPQQQNKGNFPPKAERKVNAPKNAKSAPSKGEVKRLVNYQVLLARPIRTPWFRETPRSPKSGDEEEQETIEELPGGENTEIPSIQTKPPEGSSPVSSPVSKKKPAVEDLISQEAPSTPSPSPTRPNTGVKGTGFFCPSLP